MATTSGTPAARDRFLRLGHDAVVRRHHENDDVGRLGAAGAHRREGFVARGVEERDDAARRLHVVRTDVLRDAARFTRGDLRAADVVEKRGLPVVDVTHDRDDRGTREFGEVFLFGQFAEKRFGVVRLRGEGLVAHFFDDQHRGVLVEHLVDRDHLTHQHESLDHFRRLDAHLVGEVGDRDRLGDLHFAHDRFLRLLRHQLTLTVTVLAAAAARGAEALRVVFAARLDDAALLVVVVPTAAAVLRLLLVGGMTLLLRGRRLLSLTGGGLLRLLLALLVLTLVGLRLLVLLRLVGLGLFGALGLLRRHDARLAVHHFTDLAGFFFGLAARLFPALGFLFHTFCGGLGHFGVELRLFGRALRGLQGGFVALVPEGFFTGLRLFGGAGGFRRTALGLFLGAAFGFKALGLGLGAGFRLRLRTAFGLFLGESFGFGLGASFRFTRRGGVGRLRGFAGAAGFFFGNDLRVLHEDALAAHFDLNRVGAPRAVALLDDARFLARHRDLPLRGRALGAQAVEKTALVLVAQLIGFVRLVHAGGAELVEEGLHRDLQLLREFIHRFAHGYSFLLRRRLFKPRR